jgi:AAA domain
MKLSQIQENISHRVLLYGAPGAGKTFAVGELAKHYKIDFIDLDVGGTTLLNPALGLSPAQMENINYIKLPDTKSYPVAALTVSELSMFKDGTICGDHGGWNCKTCGPQPIKPATKAVVVGGKVVKEAEPEKPATTGKDNISKLDFSKYTGNNILVIDSLTQLVSSVLAGCMAKEGRAGMFDAAQFADWGNQNKNLDSILGNFQASGKNVIVITHLASVTQEDNKELLGPVGGTSNYAKVLGRFFDHKVICQIKNGKSVLNSKHDYAGNIMTGSRTGADTSVNGLLSIFKEYRDYKKI